MLLLPLSRWTDSVNDKQPINISSIGQPLCSLPLSNLNWLMLHACEHASPHADARPLAGWPVPKGSTPETRDNAQKEGNHNHHLTQPLMDSDSE